MAKKRGKIGKYSKIGLQKKFQLLRLTQSSQHSLKQVSEKLNINYSTAKTIFFQFQNKNIKQKLTFFSNTLDKGLMNQNTDLRKKTATYSLNQKPSQRSRKISIICTQNRDKKMRNIENMRLQTDGIVETGKQGDKLYERNEQNAIRLQINQQKTRLDEDFRIENYHHQGNKGITIGNQKVTQKNQSHHIQQLLFEHNQSLVADPFSTPQILLLYCYKSQILYADSNFQQG